MQIMLPTLKTVAKIALEDVQMAEEEAQELLATFKSPMAEMKEKLAAKSKCRYRKIMLRYRNSATVSSTDQSGANI